ncbi:MAG: hypothetical protein WCJ84_02980 [Candidatus Peregrinibacteria bacterium]
MNRPPSRSEHQSLQNISETKFWNELQKQVGDLCDIQRIDTSIPPDRFGPYLLERIQKISAVLEDIKARLYNPQQGARFLIQKKAEPHQEITKLGLGRVVNFKKDNIAHFWSVTSILQDAIYKHYILYLEYLKGKAPSSSESSQLNAIIQSFREKTGELKVLIQEIETEMKPERNPQKSRENDASEQAQKDIASKTSVLLSPILGSRDFFPFAGKLRVFPQSKGYGKIETLDAHQARQEMWDAMRLVSYWIGGLERETNENAGGQGTVNSILQVSQELLQWRTEDEKTISAGIIPQKIKDIILDIRTNGLTFLKIGKRRLSSGVDPYNPDAAHMGAYPPPDTLKRMHQDKTETIEPMENRRHTTDSRRKENIPPYSPLDPAIAVDAGKVHFVRSMTALNIPQDQRHALKEWLLGTEVSYNVIR